MFSHLLNVFKLREVVVNITVMHFLHKEVDLVEEEDDGDPLEYSVVDDGVEDVPGLLDPVRPPVLQQHLVVLGGGGHEEDAGHRLETLEPLLPLRPLATNVNKQEWNAEKQIQFNYNALDKMLRRACLQAKSPANDYDI